MRYAPLILANPRKHYAWGSKTAIPAILGQAASDQPVAELWIGAHPDGPSIAKTSEGAVSIDQVIAADPVAWLGPKSAERFGRLPMLLKILAAAEPLSIQAHPTKAQAEAGFAREEAAGVPRDAKNRSYKDSNHKPELIVALSKLRALCGFRAPAEIVGLSEPVATGFLEDALFELAAGGSLASFYRAIMSAPAEEQKRVAVEAASRAASLTPSNARARAAFAEVVALAARYPGDIGVISPLLLNLVTLERDEALFLDAGELHAYLEGVGIEVMASSDNVLRGGLTPKHVDVEQLLQTLHFKTGRPTILRPESTGDPRERRYHTPAPDFALTVVDLPDQSPFDVRTEAVEILLVLEGKPTFDQTTLAPGQAVLIPNDTRYRLRGPTRIYRTFPQI
jgi:mannose-6-phosphate isomerase